MYIKIKLTQQYEVTIFHLLVARLLSFVAFFFSCTRGQPKAKLNNINNNHF